MFHNFDSYAKSSHLYRELVEAKQNGLVKKVGISLYTNQEIESVLNSDAHFDVFQIPFNLLDNSFKRQEILQKRT